MIYVKESGGKGKMKGNNKKNILVNYRKSFLDGVSKKTTMEVPLELMLYTIFHKENLKSTGQKQTEKE